MPADNPSPEMTPFEAALAAIGPAPARLDRDALMYAAGRRSSRRSVLWPAIACGFAVLSLALGTRMVAVGPRIVEKIVVVREPTAAPPADQPASVSNSLEPVETMSDLELEGYPLANSSIDLVRPRIKRGDPPPHRATVPANDWTAPPIRPLEQDLGLPPGSLREFQIRESSFLPFIW